MKPERAVAPDAGNQSDLKFRMPQGSDGAGIWQLVREAGSLDENSMYCNLLQCTHFAKTCILAESAGEIAGWLSAYIPPDEPETLFVWQVCVAEHARGQGLARKLVEGVLEREACANVTSLKTTITPDNSASWALFRGVARSLGAPLDHAAHFEKDAHFGGAHETEHLVTIGPFGSAQSDAVSSAA